MSIVDQLKTLKGRLVNTLYPRPVVFHHIPKCGGTSVGRSLRRAYLLSQGTITPEESFNAFAIQTGRLDRDRMRIDVLDFRETMLLYLLFSGTRCVSAHVPFSEKAYMLFSPQYAFVTILRNPLERFLSHYHWSHSRPNAHGQILEDLGEFLDTPRAVLLGRVYMKYFAGTPIAKLTGEQKAIDLAIKNLHRLDHVGFIDNMKNTELALRSISGKRLRISHENGGNNNEVYEEVLAGCLGKKIIQLCGPDLEIWSAVQGLRGECANQIVDSTRLASSREMRVING